MAHYIDAQGVYLGAWAGTAPPDGAVSVASPPPTASHTWDGVEWAEPPLAPHERPLTKPQWTWALDRYDLFAPLQAAIDAIPDSARRAAIRQALVRETYHYADVLALISANHDVLPPAIAALTATDIQTMWAETLAELPT